MTGDDGGISPPSRGPQPGHISAPRDSGIAVDWCLAWEAQLQGNDREDNRISSVNRKQEE